jgi:UDP-N-acetylmuramoyl-tripeptide--D-alanyl-D-alanine ligase
VIPLTLGEVAALTAGRLSGGAAADATVTGEVVIDSRAAGAGGLFVALPGEHVDGHDFAAAAAEAGAVAVLAERDLDVPCVVVEDGARALARLARGVLDRLPELVVVGVTGSSGKTSTKDLLAAVLSQAGPTVAPRGSFNNELGVPLTVLRADAATRYLVVEMGARGAGHIAELCAIARPRVGVVLNVGTAHLGEFGDRDAVAAAKGELVEALPDAAAGGCAVLNVDDPAVRAMARRTRARVVGFGEAPSAQVRAEDVRLDDAGRPRFSLVATEPGTVDEPVALRLYGEHHVSNALAAAAAGLWLGVPGGAIAEALSTAQATSRWRMEVTERPDGVTVVNDAYNANPESVRAALKALAAMGRGRRTWAVLGEMLELGPASVAEHDAVGRLAVRLGVSRLVAVGQGARAAHNGAVHEGSWGEESVFVPDADAAYRLLAEELRPGDVVLVKSSNSIGLRFLGDRLAGREAGAGR